MQSRTLARELALLMLGQVNDRGPAATAAGTAALAEGSLEGLLQQALTSLSQHVRDALDLVDKRAPGMLLRFGGHAAAAGVTLLESDFTRFQELLEDVVRGLIAPSDLLRVIETDGALESSYLSLSVAKLLEAQIWGQGFPQPVFSGEFAVRNQRVVGESTSG